MTKDAKKQIELQLLQQHLQQLQQQFASLQNQLVELKAIKENLNDIKSIKDQKAIVPLGAGIFFESHVKQVKDVLLNAGANVVVKKDIESAKKILDNQIKDLEKIALQLESNLSKGSLQLQAAQV